MMVSEGEHAQCLANRYAIGVCKESDDGIHLARKRFSSLQHEYITPSDPVVPVIMLLNMFACTKYSAREHLLPVQLLLMASFTNHASTVFVVMSLGFTSSLKVSQVTIYDVQCGPRLVHLHKS